MSDIELQILQSVYEQTNGELRNITRTTADVSQKMLIDTMSKVQFRIISGQQSYNQAIRQAVNEIAAEGVKITYPSGRQYHLESVVRTAVMTGVNQATSKITIANAERMESDLVTTTAHLGARTGEGYKGHINWQGKVFSISGKRYPKEEKRIGNRIEKLSDATGYGKVDGLCGANCRHSILVWIEGHSELAFKEYDREENRNRYEAQQEQRKRERNVRNTKRKLLALKESMSSCTNEAAMEDLQKDYDKQAYRLRQQQREYKEFCKENGLQTENERMQIAKYSRKEAAEAFHASEREKKNINENGMNDKKGKSILQFGGDNKIFDNKTPIEKCNISKELTGKYIDRESKWKGTVVIDDKKCSVNNITGRKEWSCTILVSSKTQPKTYIHEMLHSRSGSYLSPVRLPRYKKMEEASTEYLARQICMKEKISFTYTERRGVNALAAINKIIGLEENDFLFAQRLYNKDITIRYTWLENKVRRYLMEHSENKEVLESCLDELRGI